MKYLIFANNKDLTISNQYKTILQFIDEEDIIITLNHCLPLNTIFADLKHENLYHFSRRSFNLKIPYSGLNIINANKDKFKKIFLYPHPESIGDSELKIKVMDYINNNTSFKITDIDHMPGFGKHSLTQQTHEFLEQRHNQKKNMSTGLISYIYIKQIKKPEDKIFLIGFTHQMNINFHNNDGEKEFFAKEEELGLCKMIKLIS